jgi:hypothetical protein
MYTTASRLMKMQQVRCGTCFFCAYKNFFSLLASLAAIAKEMPCAVDSAFGSNQLLLC